MSSASWWNRLVYASPGLTNGGMENGEKNERESRLLALELDPTQRLHLAQQQGAWDRNLSCLQSCSGLGLGFCTLGIVKNIKGYT